MTLMLQQDSDARWSLTGPLNAHTIRKIWRKGHHLMDHTSAAQIEIDLTHITHPDSASVALLLDWLRYAKRLQKSIRLHHVPKKMQDIIHLSNLQDII